MREIKFRVWDKSEERMYPNVTQLGVAGGIYMQYTGIKDEEGTEIYEGDIYEKHGSTYLVIYDNGFYWHKIYDSWLDRNVFKDNERSWLIKTHCELYSEVIGNIYENPELLEVMK